MTLRVDWLDARAFRRRAYDFLLARELDNSPLLGRLGRVESGSPIPADFAVVTEGENTLMAATISDGDLHVSDGPESALAALVASVAERNLALVAISGPNRIGPAFVERYCALTGHKPAAATRLIIYRLDSLAPIPSVLGHARRADARDAVLLVAWTRDFWDQHLKVRADLSVVVNWAIRNGDAWLWCNPADAPVAMAWRAGTTPNGARVGPVYTPPEQRGKGYARAITGHLSGHLLAQGHAFCSLLADESDPAANGVYRALGYRPVGSYGIVRIEA